MFVATESDVESVKWRERVAMLDNTTDFDQVSDTL